MIATERQLLDAVKHAPWPEPADDVLDRVLARRAAGQRIILPTDSSLPVPQTGTRAMTALIAASMLIAALVIVISRSPDVFAGDTDGVLHVAPPFPRVGGRMVVEYEAPAMFASEPRLILRARLRKVVDDAYAEIGRYALIPLDRATNGHFRAEFTLPDSVVYAGVVVEDTLGRRIDAHDDRLWEVLTSADGKRPSYEALEQQENAWMGRNWEAAFAAAQQAVQLYPDDPRSWGTLWFYQQLVLGPAALDTVRPQHLARLAFFQRTLSARPRVPASIMGTMFFYARGLRDTVSASYWDARLRRDAPADPFTVQSRVGEIASRTWKRDSAGAVVAYERLWQDVGNVPGALIHQGRILPRVGLNAALRVRDTAAVSRWAARQLINDPGDSLGVAEQLVQLPAFRDTALVWIRSAVAAAQRADDARRPLWRTRSEHERQTSLRYGAILGRYGEMLLGLGRYRNAADTLDIAASIGWKPSLMRSAATAHLALGDTLTALRLLAGVAADPLTPDSAVSRIETLVLHLPPTTWQQWKDSAAAMMRERVLAEGTKRPIRGEVRIRAIDGTTTTLTGLRRGREAIVVFWSAHCGPALEAIPDIERLTRRLSSSGTPVIVLSEDSLTAEDLTLVRSKGGTFPVYQDVAHDAQRTFSNFGTPVFYVLDAEGRIRFTWAQPEQIPRQLAALDAM